MPKHRMPLHHRIVFWIVVPVVVVGAGISALLIAQMSAPMVAFLGEHFEANLRLASDLALSSL